MAPLIFGYSNQAHLGCYALSRSIDAIIYTQTADQWTMATSTL